MQHDSRDHMSDAEVQHRLHARRLSRRRLLFAGAASGASVGLVIGSNALAQSQPQPTGRAGPQPRVAAPPGLNSSRHSSRDRQPRPPGSYHG